MQFNIQQNLISPVATGLCVLCALASGFMIASRNLQKTAIEQAKTDSDAAFRAISAQRHQDRARALDTIAKEYRVKNCWVADGVFTVDRVVPPAETGTLPTSCLISRNRAQFAYIAAYNGAMRMQFVFTQIELTNALSRI